MATATAMTLRRFQDLNHADFDKKDVILAIAAALQDREKLLAELDKGLGQLLIDCIMAEKLCSTGGGIGTHCVEWTQDAATRIGANVRELMAIRFERIGQ